ncbi:CoA-transferase [Streptomyces sp. NPDC001604]|uniref:CoA-transferase n=1 Tax=Streptomyces sp. NPDC001604 TaxID=3364593 RepID=UPI00369018BB
MTLPLQDLPTAWVFCRVRRRPAALGRALTRAARTPTRPCRASRTAVLVGWFGIAGIPVELIDTPVRRGASELTVLSNNAGNGDTGPAALPAEGRVRRTVCPFPLHFPSNRTRGSQLRRAPRFYKIGSTAPVAYGALFLAGPAAAPRRAVRATCSTLSYAAAALLGWCPEGIAVRRIVGSRRAGGPARKPRRTPDAA